MNTDYNIVLDELIHYKELLVAAEHNNLTVHASSIRQTLVTIIHQLVIATTELPTDMIPVIAITIRDTLFHRDHTKTSTGNLYALLHGIETVPNTEGLPRPTASGKIVLPENITTVNTTKSKLVLF